MNNDLISREALKEIIETYRPTPITSDYLQGKNNMIDYCIAEINNAPTVELDESVIQEVLNKRCMTAVANEYLVALRGNGTRPQGEWIEETSGYYSYFRCNNCNSYCSSVKTNFCPNCGADMRRINKCSDL